MRLCLVCVFSSLFPFFGGGSGGVGRSGRGLAARAGRDVEEHRAAYRSDCSRRLRCAPSWTEQQQNTTTRAAAALIEAAMSLPRDSTWGVGLRVIERLRPMTDSFIHSFIHSFLPSFLDSLIHSLIEDVHD